MKTIDIIIPAFNESKNIAILHQEIIAVFGQISNYTYKIIFVDDGSEDDTFEQISKLSRESSKVKYIKLSRNFGHQAALKAGIDHANDSDAIINMDCDLQHPAKVIPELIKPWEGGGYDVVNAIRIENKGDNWLKKVASKIFYYIINKISKTNITPGGADFRLMDKKVVKALSKTKEHNLFLRGLIPWVGFQQTNIYFKAPKRLHGKSSYNFKKMLTLALNGITSISSKPLEFAVYLGFIFSSTSLLYIPYIVYSKINNLAIQGWASVVVTVVFFGGVQLIVMGIIGIYIGKMFLEVKNRPTYIIDKKRLKNDSTKF